MSNKRKKAELQAKRQTKIENERAEKRERLREAGRLANGIVIPVDAIAADLSKQAPNGSYDPPRYYVDYDFTCIDCGVDQVWTAAQQQWYYEEANGSIYATAVRCRPCRQRRRAELEAQRKAAKPGQDENAE